MRSKVFENIFCLFPMVFFIILSGEIDEFSNVRLEISRALIHIPMELDGSHYQPQVHVAYATIYE